MDKKVNLNDALKKLESIAAWFESRREVDVEEGLKKVKEGAGLIVGVKSRLKEIENEFEEVKRGLEDSEEKV
ncbi:exodeoxyribonuclease VII small subunit [bacterium]|nr:exodeoxyribonuclease VII small subunit [bacterium]